MPGDKIIPIGTSRCVRDRLLEAMGDLLARSGFQGASLEAVAAVSGVDRATVLRHFKDIDALVAAFGQSPLYWPSVAELRGDVPDRFAAMPFRAQVSQYFKATIRGLLVRPRTLSILAWELLDRHPLTRLLEVPRMRSSLEFFQDAAGEISESVDLNTLVAVLSGAAIFLAVRSRQSGVCSGLNLYDDADRERVDHVLDQLTAGVLRTTQDE